MNPNGNIISYVWQIGACERLCQQQTLARYPVDEGKSTKRMKVGLVTTEFLPVQGGIASYCLNLCRALSDRVEFHVFTGSVKSKDVESNTGDDGFKVQIHSISSGSNNSLSILGYQLRLVRHLPRLIKEYDLDLVHSAGPLADQLLRIRGINVPHLLTYHTTLSGQRQGTASSGARFKDLHRSEKLTLLSYPLLRLYESLSLRRTKNIIAVSKAVRDELIEWYHYKGEVTVIPNGIDTNMFQPSKKRNAKKRVLFCGRLIAWKGPGFVIKAMPQVLNQHPDVSFVFGVVGDRKPYLRMLEEMGIPQEHFEFRYVNYQDMPQFYNSGDMLVLPSLLEGFPMTILEAMACGLPVVASNVGDVAELVQDGVTGFLLDRGDYEALADRINLLLGDGALRERMSQNARRLVADNYSAEIMGERTFEVYQQVLENRR